MDTSLEHVQVEHVHELEPHILVRRAQACVLMLIASDALSVLAILAGGGYLRALNTEHAFTATGDFGPAVAPGLVAMIGLVLSGIAYFLWERRARRAGQTGQVAFLLVATILMLAAGIIETWLGAGLKYGIPISAYESVLLLITWFTAVHLLLTAIIGVLVWGRVLRGRIAGREFIAEVTGYWWYYTVIAGILLWVFATFFA